MAAAFVDVWVNCPDRATAERIAAACVGDRLAACANVYAPIESLYRCKGAHERAREIPLLLKTRASLFDELCRAVKSMHPYEVPSIVATELPLVDRDYAEWLLGETKEPA